MLGAPARANGFPNPMSRTPLTASGEPEPFKPKMIKRLAQAYEISALLEKEAGEAGEPEPSKAKSYVVCSNSQYGLEGRRLPRSSQE